MENLRKVVIFYKFEESELLQEMTCYVNKKGMIEKGFVVGKLYNWNRDAYYQGHEEVFFQSKDIKNFL
ncbi:hypothetical protein OAK75_09005 [Bacteriovoracales bacterium]|nr:hypothetical protein [Bacteriovoracales bacterium]